MPPPTAPSGWVWLDATNQRQLQVPVGNFAAGTGVGFVDLSGNWIIFPVTGGNFRFYYSTNQGASWIDGGQLTGFVNAPFADVGMWWDQKNELLFFVGCRSSDTDRTYVWVFEWNSGTKTFSYGDEVDAAGGVTGTTRGITGIGGTDPSSGDVYACMFYYPSEFPDGVRATSVSYDLGTNTLTWEGAVELTSHASSAPIDVVYPAGANADPLQLPDPLNDTFYVSHSGLVSDAYVSAIAWDAVDTRFEVTGTPSEIADGVNTRSTVAFGYYPAQDRYYACVWDGITGDDIYIYKSNSSDPLSTWTKVWDYQVDEPTPVSPPFNHNESSTAVFNRQSGTMHIMVRDVSLPTDEELVLYAYDVVADSHTETLMGWRAATDINEFTGSGHFQAFTGESDLSAIVSGTSAIANEWLGMYVIEDVPVSQGGGIGFWV